MRPGGGPAAGVAELPGSLHALLVRHLGGVARTVVVPGSAFSSAVAGVVETARWGRVFVKVAARDAWMAEDYRVEAKVLRAMPGGVRAPSLLALLEDEQWMVLCLSVVSGRAPGEPWTPEDVRSLTSAYEALPRLLDPAPEGCTDLRSVAELIDPTPKFRFWRDVASGVPRAIGVADLAPWCRGALRQLAELEASWPEATGGQALLHFDPRTDNQMVDDHGDAWLLDWSRACLGAPWVDLVTWAPSVHAAGHDMSDLLGRGPLCGPAVAERIDALLAALAGYWLDVSATPQPAAPWRFQSRSAAGALDLLRRRLA